MEKWQRHGIRFMRNRKGKEMKTVVKLKIILACYTCYMTGEILGSLFTYQNNRIAVIAIVAVPMFILLMYIAAISRQVQPKKKKLPTHRNVH
jgi:hypothetical protein